MKPEQGFSDYIYGSRGFSRLVVVSLVLFVSISVVETSHSAIESAEGLSLICEEGFMGHSSMILVRHKTVDLSGIRGVPAPKIFSYSHGNAQGFARGYHKSVSDVTLKTALRFWEGVSFPAGKLLVYTHLIGWGLAKVHNIYPDKGFCLKMIVSGINDLYIGPEIGVRSFFRNRDLPTIKVGGYYSQNNNRESQSSHRPFGGILATHELPHPAPETAFHLGLRILCWLLSMIFCLVETAFVLVTITFDDSRYAALSILGGIGCILLAGVLFHIGFIVYGFHL
jgi:hypothetical protein